MKLEIKTEENIIRSNAMIMDGMIATNMERKEIQWISKESLIKSYQNDLLLHDDKYNIWRNKEGRLASFTEFQRHDFAKEKLKELERGKDE